MLRYRSALYVGFESVKATRYLEELMAGGFLIKHRAGRSNYYVNLALLEILTAEQMTSVTH